jgi:hypothetical protein
VLLKRLKKATAFVLVITMIAFVFNGAAAFAAPVPAIPDTLITGDVIIGNELHSYSELGYGGILDKAMEVSAKVGGKVGVYYVFRTGNTFKFFDLTRTVANYVTANGHIEWQAIRNGMADIVPGEILTVPQMQARTHDSITVTTGTASGTHTIEYAISTSNALPGPAASAYGTSRTFTDLEANTDYYVWARTAPRGNIAAGVARPSAAIRTDAIPKAAGAATTGTVVLDSKTTTSLTFTAGTVEIDSLATTTQTVIQYAVHTSGTTAPAAPAYGTSLAFTGLTLGTQYFVWARTAENDDHNAGPARVVSAGDFTVRNGAAVTGLTVVAASTSQSVIQITTGSAASGQTIEYTILAGTTQPVAWATSLFPIATDTFSGLTSGTQYWIGARTVANDDYQQGAPTWITATTLKATGATLTTPATEGTVTHNSITVVAASGLTPATGQDIEYAISTNNTNAPETGWQDGLTFTVLNAETEYFVWARAKESTTHAVGAASPSAGITTGTAPEPPITMRREVISSLEAQFVFNRTLPANSEYYLFRDGVWVRFAVTGTTSNIFNPNVTANPAGLPFIVVVGGSSIQADVSAAIRGTNSPLFNNGPDRNNENWTPAGPWNNTDNQMGVYKGLVVDF